MRKKPRAVKVLVWGMIAAAVTAAALVTTAIVRPAAAADAASSTGPELHDPDQGLQRTSFQTGGSYDPRVDIKSDVAMVYGINSSFPDRLKSWTDHGYIGQLMTGVAWGNYQDYFDGRWDGRSHADEAQTDRDGNLIQHGPTVPYVAPSDTYGKYLSVGVLKAVDAGAGAVFLEEPEFWVRAGYSGSFQREWQSYYHEPWIPPHSSPDAQYRASRLKYFLYRRALQQVFDAVSAHAAQIGRPVPCYVPTHSMLNYAHWRIVSPEQSLVLLHGCNGYIGQVWTGTARTPNVYRGVLKERTFETAFFEYGVLHNLVRSTGRRMYYLNDPVEDNPDHNWDDYRRNWEQTLTASLLWPDVWHYEVAPWPERPFIGEYPLHDAGARQAGEQRVRIPPGYATELLTVFNVLNDMNQRRISWDAGTPGIGILVSDTMMFQRGEPNPSDPNMGSFYGLAMPLIKSGIPADPVQLENVRLPGYLKPYRILFLTYEGMKPLDPAFHTALANWVHQGGVLVFVDNDQDPYNAVREWWDTGQNSYTTPRQHLFEQLGLGRDPAEGMHPVGKGALLYRKASPAALTRDAAGAETVLDLARQASRAAKLRWRETGALILRRGPYVIAAGLDEGPALPPRTLTGRFVNLFDPTLSVRRQVSLIPGVRFFLVDLDRLAGPRPRVVASASKVLGVQVAGSGFRFHSSGPSETTCATRIRLPHKPRAVEVEGLSPADVKWSWDSESRTVLTQYPNSPRGRWITVRE